MGESVSGSEEKRDSSAYLHLPPLLPAKVAPVENICRSSSFFPSLENLHPLFVLMQTFHLMCRDNPTQSSQVPFKKCFLASSLGLILFPPQTGTKYKTQRMN
ncbi:hypothetical protein CapIbe_005717 [Capra ibex]